MDNEKWFNNNYDWLKKWIDHGKSVKDHNGMQIFKKDSLIERSSLVEKVRKYDYSKDANVMNFHQENFSKLKTDILLASVFGVKRETVEFDGYFDDDGSWVKEKVVEPYSLMSGFLEQSGRLPIKDDKVLYEYLGNRWGLIIPIHEKTNGMGEIRFYKHGQYYTFLTECRLRIVYVG